MKLLLVNFEMDDDSAVLAWQAAVARKLASRCESVVVLTQRVGKFEGSDNLQIERIPQRPMGVPFRLGGGWLVNAQVVRLWRRHRIQACFIHMASEWGYRLAPALRVLGVPTLLWYAHGTVTARLRLAHALVDRVVTSTPQGFRLRSRKVEAIGEGVDTDLFRLVNTDEDANYLLYVGRVSRRKKVESLLDVVASVRELQPSPSLRLRIVGPTLTADDLAYDRELRARAWDLDLQDRVEFVGYVPHRQLPRFYNDAFLHISLSETGSMDKTVLEALACGCPVLAKGEAYSELLADHPEFLVKREDPEGLARRVLDLYRIRHEIPRDNLRRIVEGRHDLNTYVGKVLQILGGLIR